MTFDTTKVYILENERVSLRPLIEEDMKHLLPFAMNEPTLWQYSLISAAGTEGMNNYIQKALTGKSLGSEYPFIVFDKEVNKYAGTTRFYDIQRAADALQLGFTWYGSAFQGTGLNRHCKYLMLDFAFDTVGVQRVEFRADNRNQRSIAAMKSIGCVEEGVLRSNVYSGNGDRRDSIILSILKDEWYESKKQHLLTKLL